MPLYHRKNQFPVHRIVICVALCIFLLSTETIARAQDDVPTGAWLTFRADPAHTGTINIEGPPEEIELKGRWRISGENDPISASPAVTEDGTVYIGTQGGFVAAIQPEGGAGWVFKVEGPVHSSPAVDENGNVFVVTSNGYMYYIAPNGELLWKSDFTTHISSSPVISGSTAYIGTNDGVLLGINLIPDPDAISENNRVFPDDIIDFEFLANGNVESSPAFTGNTVFFGGGEYVYALNPIAGDTGTGDETDGGSQTGDDQQQTPNPVKWEASVNSAVYSSPSIKGETVYIGADDGYLYAFKENVTTNNNLTSLFSGRKPGLWWEITQSDTTNIIQEGELIWKRKTGGKIRSSPAVAAPVIIIPEISFTEPAQQTSEINLVYVGSDDGNLYAFDATGQFKWKFPTSGPVRSSPAVDKNGDIYFGSDDGNVYALFPDGALKWRYQTYGAVRSSPAIGPEKRLYVGSDDGYLYCLGQSDNINTKPDLDITLTASPDAIENDGNPTTITAEITSNSKDPNYLSRIASVTADLSFLKLLGVETLDGDPVELTTVPMSDDGKNEDEVEKDGTFTYAFGITIDENNIYPIPGVTTQDDFTGIFTHFLLESITDISAPPTGPVPIMVSVTDIYGNRISKPFALNISKKITGCVDPNAASSSFQINNRLKEQTLSISFTSGFPSILSITPDQGKEGDRVSIAVEGRNTNFTKNKTRIEIYNVKGKGSYDEYKNEGKLIAQATPSPGTDDVEVSSDTSLTAFLNIQSTAQLPGEQVIGRWDVLLITEVDVPCSEEGTEVVIAPDAFTITGTTPTTTPTTIPVATPSLLGGLSANQSGIIHALQEECVFTIDITNAAGIPAKNSPFTFISGYSGEITIPFADSGIWNLTVSLSSCTVSQTDNKPSFKFISTSSNFGFLTGEVRNGFTGEGVDGAKISALTGEGPDAIGNSTVSSGGGYYMLPLAVRQDKYTVIASKDGLVDTRDDIVITEDAETVQNFSLKPDINCPVTSLVKDGNLNVFYNVRDGLLAKNDQGRRWVNLYYRHSREVTHIVLHNALLRKKAEAFIMKAAQQSGHIMKGEKADRSLKPMLAELIDAFINKGSPELKTALRREKNHVLSFIKSE